MNIKNKLSLVSYEYAPIGLALTENRIICACNQKFLNIFGYARSQLIGQSFQILYKTRAEFDRVRDIGLPNLAVSTEYTDERIMRKSNGESIWVQFRARTLSPQNPLSQITMSFAPLPKTEQGPVLSKREREIVAFLTQGKTSKDIARELSLSPRTIEDVRARLLRKFKVSNTAQLLGKLAGPAF